MKAKLWGEWLPKLFGCHELMAAVSGPVASITWFRTDFDNFERVEPIAWPIGVLLTALAKLTRHEPEDLGV